MGHVIQPAASARAKCRGCAERLEAGTLRFGEVLPNPFAEGEMTHWYHLECAAYKRPGPLLETLEAAAEPPADAAALKAEASLGIVHRRLPRIDRVGRAPTGRAQCRSCRSAIAKGDWRIGLVFWEDGRFEPAGFVHAPCAAGYFGTTAVMPRVRRFSPGLSEAERTGFEAALHSPAPEPSPGD